MPFTDYLLEKRPKTRKTKIVFILLPKISTVEVRERIIIESGALFGKFGIRSMTMDILAEEMGISKRTIYEQFKDKDTLLLEVIGYYKQRRTEEAHQIIENSSDVIEAMFRIMKITINQVEQMNPVFFHDFRKYHARVYQRLSDPGDIRDMSITRKILENGVSQKIFMDQIHIDIVNRSLHQMFELFGHDSSLAREGYRHMELFDHIIIPYLRGISTRKGNELLEKHRKMLS